MTKPERGLGWTRFVEYEPATQCTRDQNGTAICSTKVRIKFMQNAVQHIEGSQWDYDALLYYTFPATWHGGNDYRYDPRNSTLISATINQVTQFRLGWGSSWFHNWGHSVVITGGEPTKLEYGFWRNTEQTGGSYNDIYDAVYMLSNIVKDLGTSQDPWLEFNANSQFANSTVIYSAGDADQYANPDRILLNRQRQYAVFYRPDALTEWDWITVVPSYNFEFNDFNQVWEENFLEGVLNKDGTLKNGEGQNSDIREIEKIGCQNCPNPSLEQVSFYNKTGDLLYSITFRAFVGADQTLIIYGPEKPATWNFTDAPTPQNLPRPIDYDINKTTGKKTVKSDDEQTFPDDSSWRDYVAEATVWEWLRSENPLNADLFLQYQVTDSTEWAPIPCSDGGTCGYRAVRWNLEANYYFDGDTEVPWLITQLLGEVGMRTLGFSYVSGRYEGSGIEFALDQPTFYQWQQEGFPNEEVAFMFDARALTTPKMLAWGWEVLHDQE